MNIIEAIGDPNLFGGFLGKDHASWQNWTVALQCLYGHRIHPKHNELITQCTGRSRRLLPRAGFDAGLFLCGRRSGKSRAAALCAGFEAVFGGHETRLAPGEVGIVGVIAPTRKQAGIIHRYVRALFAGSGVLAGEIVSEGKESFTLRNGLVIEVHTGDWRTVRGHTLCACIVDEVCFFGIEEESKVKSDTELTRAIKPSLATSRGRLVCISSPYARKGWAYQTWKRDHANDGGRALVWVAPSLVMNPCLDPQIVEDALQEDRAAARAEWLAEWREDVSEFLPRSVIESAVVGGRKELMPGGGVRYHGFVDVSGGRQDDAALAIGHRAESGKVVMDYLKRYGAPHSPVQIVENMCDILKRYGIKRIVGDRYSAQWVVDAFAGHGLRYAHSTKDKSSLYLEMLPGLCSGQVELPDNEQLVSQLANLERRTRSGGRDTIDHPQGGKDDLANSVAGCVYECRGGAKIVVGGLGAGARARGLVAS